MSQLEVPVNIEESEINTTFNSFALLIFGTGMYTIVYFQTMYIHFQRSSSKHRLVPATITLLYLSSMIQTGLQWYITKWQFVNNGDSRNSVFQSLIGTPEWSDVLYNIAAYSGFVLADGLLIWRCFFVWNRSFRVILLLLLLVTIESGLFLLQIILHVIYSSGIVSMAAAAKFADLLAAAYFTSAATSLTATTLIAYRIYSVPKQENSSSRRFKQILDIIVQSGVVYSLSLLTMAISTVIVNGNIVGTQSLAFLAYANSLSVFIPGISTTILVARVGLLAPDTTFPSGSVHLSGLQFHARSTQHTGTLENREITPSTGTINTDRISVGDREQGGAKA
ncbi:hypothetical protein BJ912DRAFT_1042509 [Pholiota molesta]|nr:hypothetical protein BJ912DRAFT_1042509 [Pholiota molesta]